MEGDGSTQAYNYYYPLSWSARYVECVVSAIEQGIRTLAAFQDFSGVRLLKHWQQVAALGGTPAPFGGHRKIKLYNLIPWYAL